MDKAAALSIARKYTDEVVKEMSPDKILLFGSYAKGTAREDSDIDIAVIFNEFSGDWFNTCTKLSGLIWKVNTAIEPVLLDSKADKSGFVEEVLRTGEIIFQQ